MPEAYVQAFGATKRFGDVTAVDNVDLEVYRGKFLSVIGPSGCGRTTMMRLIAGLDQPDSGEQASATALHRRVNDSNHDKSKRERWI